MIEMFPDMIKCFPDMIVMFPDMIKCLPDMIVMFPDMIKCLPDTIVMFPDMIKMFPDIIKGSGYDQKTPDTEKAPDTEEFTPDTIVHDTLPDLESNSSPPTDPGMTGENRPCP
jgi:hypothetical protein